MDEREIEAVAEVLAWEFGISERPSQRIIDASAKAVAALDRVRVARGDDESRRHCKTCGALEGGQHDATQHPEPFEWEAARSPQDEDHEDARRAIADAVKALDAGLPGEAWAALRAAMQRLEEEEE